MAATSRTRNQRIASDAVPAITVAGEISALRLEACAILDKHSTRQNTFERASIEQAFLGTYGPPLHVLRNLTANMPKHSARTILDTIVRAIDAGLPDEVLLTDDHITVRTALSSHRTQIIKGKSPVLAKVDFAEYESIMFYALNNIEDGHLIVSMYVDRGMRTLQGILDLIPVLKSSSHRALTEGVL